MLVLPDREGRLILNQYLEINQIQMLRFYFKQLLVAKFQHSAEAEPVGGRVRRIYTTV